MLEKTKTEMYKNSLGLEFEVKTRFVKIDDFGNTLNDYCIGAYDAAKMALYKDKATLYPSDIEAKKISQIMAMGINNYLNQN